MPHLSAPLEEAPTLGTGLSNKHPLEEAPIPRRSDPLKWEKYLKFY